MWRRWALAVLLSSLVLPTIPALPADVPLPARGANASDTSMVRLGRRLWVGTDTANPLKGWNAGLLVPVILVDTTKGNMAIAAWMQLSKLPPGAHKTTHALYGELFADSKCDDTVSYYTMVGEFSFNSAGRIVDTSRTGTRLYGVVVNGKPVGDGSITAPNFVYLDVNPWDLPLDSCGKVRVDTTYGVRIQRDDCVGPRHTTWSVYAGNSIWVGDTAFARRGVAVGSSRHEAFLGPDTLRGARGTFTVVADTLRVTGVLQTSIEAGRRPAGSEQAEVVIPFLEVANITDPRIALAAHALSASNDAVYLLIAKAGDRPAEIRIPVSLVTPYALMSDSLVYYAEGNVSLDSVSIKTVREAKGTLSVSQVAADRTRRTNQVLTRVAIPAKDYLSTATELRLDFFVSLPASGQLRIWKAFLYGRSQ